jgi:septum site-determining protein MinD
MGEVYVVTSGKGGLGKTTTTANVGAGLATLGKRVCLLDADIGLRNLDVVMGLENRIVFDVVDVIEGRCRLKQALIKDKRFDGLYLLPAAQTREKDAVTPEQMIKLTSQLRDEFDFVLIDCPAGIEQGFKNAIAGADKAIVVTTPEISSVRDADRIVGLLEAAEISDQLLILNRIRINMVQRGDMLDLSDVTEILAIDVLGMVPDCEAVITSTNRGEPAVSDRDSVAGRAFADICRRLTGENVPMQSFEEKKGFFARLKCLFKRGG